MSYDGQTVNVLILEHATMVVAIMIAFGATFLASFELNDILYFIFATGFVICFMEEFRSVGLAGCLDKIADCVDSFNARAAS